MNPIEIGPGGEFALGGENFVIEVGGCTAERPTSFDLGDLYDREK